MAVVRGPETHIDGASDNAPPRINRANDSVDASTQEVSLTVQQKGLFGCFYAAGHKALLAAFELRHRPPVYKTAALPSELRRLLQKVAQAQILVSHVSTNLN